MKVTGDTKEDRQRGQPGSPALIQILLEEAAKRGHSATHLAEVLGVTYVRLRQWCRETARLENAHRDVLVRAAHYLGWPTLFVLMRSGRVKLEDFVWPRVDVQARMAQVIDRMRMHPRVGPLVPASLSTLDLELQLLIAHLFLEWEAAAQRESVDWLDVLRDAVRAHSPEHLQRPNSQA